MRPLALTVLLAAVEAVPIVPQKYGHPPVASPTMLEQQYVHGKRFDEHGNEIKASPHQWETRRRLVEHMEAEGVEFEAAVNPVVNAIAWDGIEGYTTYELALDLATRSDAENVYAVYGSEDSPLTLPPAFQVEIPFGSVFGGVNPAVIDVHPASAFDSWLTIGITTGASTSTDKLALLGLDLAAWSTSQGVVCENGAMFYMDPADGPTLEDRDGPLGPRSDRGEIVVAQLTVPNEGSYTVTVNAQGKTKGWRENRGTAQDGNWTNWNEEGITFTFGDVVQTGTHTEPPPPPPSANIHYEAAAVTAVTQTISTDGIEGHSTFRLALELQGDALDVYSIYGIAGHPMTIPPAFHTAPPFGVDVGGVSPLIYALQRADAPGAAAGEFDSWLTVGLTEGSGPELTSIGILWPSWTDSTGLEVTDGSVFWLDPNDGPSRDDRDGPKGSASSGGAIVVAQLTVPNDQPFSATLNAQGHRMADKGALTSWNEMDIEFKFGRMTAAIGPCTIQASTAATSGQYYEPLCDGTGGFLAMQCVMKDHCFCVDEDGRPLPPDRVTTHATGGAHFTEAACLAARKAAAPAVTAEPLLQTGSVYQGDGDEINELIAQFNASPGSSQAAAADETMSTPLTASAPEPTGQVVSCLQTPFTTHRPCGNGGVCIDTQEHIADDYYREPHCDCGNSHWTGPYCDELDACASSPCLNNGVCEQLFGEFFCKCDAEHSGPHCELAAGGAPEGAVQPVAGHDTSQGEDRKQHGGGHRRLTLVMCFLVAGFAAVGIVAYKQRTEVLGRANVGSVYENSIYGGMAVSVGDGTPGNTATQRRQPPSVIDKAKAMASKVGAKGVSGVAPHGGRSIYDVYSTPDGL